MYSLNLPWWSFVTFSPASYGLPGWRNQHLPLHFPQKNSPQEFPLCRKSKWSKWKSSQSTGDNARRLPSPGSQSDGYLRSRLTPQYHIQGSSTMLLLSGGIRRMKTTHIGSVWVINNTDQETPVTLRWAWLELHCPKTFCVATHCVQRNQAFSSE